MSIKLLDCTLREAPIKGLYFTEKYIQKFINYLEKAGLDIIECGFLKDDEHVLGSTIFNRVEQIEPYLKDKKKNTLYVALLDYGRYELKNLSNFNAKSIDGIRICFKKHQKDEVFAYAKAIQDKGYKVFLQHIDTLDYTDVEIIEFIEKVNELRPYSYSIVDTFGSMYADDVLHLYSLIDRHLSKDIILGFHAHNNLLLSVANAQLFTTLSYATRDICIDGSILGCARGAGNIHTELIANFLNKKFQKTYDLDVLLDICDTLMPKIQKLCSWGYNIPYFLAGIHSSHVFNINHLLRRHNIHSKDLREIIAKLDERQKKAYDYALLERLYVEHFDKKIDDSLALDKLRNIIKDKKILFLLPGASLNNCQDKIKEFMAKNKDYISISLNHYNENFTPTLLFFSQSKRFELFENLSLKNPPLVVLTSNIKTKPKQNELILNYSPLIKYGYINLDVSVILALRLFLREGVRTFAFAGFDGLSKGKNNYFSEDLSINLDDEDLELANKEIKEMLQDMKKEYDFESLFLTPSIYEDFL